MGWQERVRADEAPDDGRERLRRAVHETLVEAVGRGGDRAAARQAGLARAAELAPEAAPLTRLALVEQLLRDVFSYGPLQEFLDDDAVTEIMVNGPGEIYVERDGEHVLTGRSFRDEGHLLAIVDKILTPARRQVDESHPWADARLPGGSRVNVVVPPVAVDGPAVTIRKFRRQLTMDELVRGGTLPGWLAERLGQAVRSRCNLFVAGGAGSGKTTLLNCLSAFVPAAERIVTIEDTAELQLQQPHRVRLEARPPNAEGKGEVTVRDLVRNALRMKPDRIVVGEVRAAEAIDMLQAMNTGHEGGLTTVHANSARDTLSRLETMVLYSGLDLPMRAIREQVAAACDLLVYLRRFPGGRRRVTEAVAVEGLDGAGQYVLAPLVRYEPARDRLEEAGELPPRLAARLAAAAPASAGG